MTTLLGLIGLAIYIVSIIAFAAGVTWVVVRLTPRRKEKPPAQPSPQ